MYQKSYCPDAPLEPPEPKTDPMVCGMLERVERLEDEMNALREEKEIFSDTFCDMRNPVGGIHDDLI